MQGTRRRDGFSSARNEPRALVLQPRPWYNLRGLTSHTDDGFHEIQLNGKQLVFLFMAATVVSVVIFLCGVLVGRGVRAERGAPDSAALGDVPIVDQSTATAGAAPAGSDPRNAPPPPAVDDLSYFNRLEKPEAVQDDLKQPSPRPPAPDTRQNARAAEPPPVTVPPPSAKPPSAKPPTAKPPTAKPTSAPTPAAVPATAPPAASKPEAAAARPASSPATGGKPGFAVQLAALNSRGEADAMAKRLSAKGYEAYVQDPAAGGPSIFRVRVGNYPTRGEAETVAAKLEKEGQFKPWVAAR
jgi:cell division septation protein DedD